MLAQFLSINSWFSNFYPHLPTASLTEYLLLSILLSIEKFHTILSITLNSTLNWKISHNLNSTIKNFHTIIPPSKPSVHFSNFPVLLQGSHSSSVRTVSFLFYSAHLCIITYFHASNSHFSNSSLYQKEGNRQIDFHSSKSQILALFERLPPTFSMS